MKPGYNLYMVSKASADIQSKAARPWASRKAAVASALYPILMVNFETRYSQGFIAVS
jgi:hypothetical protein